MISSSCRGRGRGWWCFSASLSGSQVIGHQRRDCRVVGSAWAHGLAVKCWRGVVVTADVDWLAPNGVELGNDGRLVLGQGLGQGRELRLQCSVFGLGGQGLSPVQRQVEVAAAVVARS